MDQLIIHCFTDGAASANGKAHAKAAWAIVWPEHPDWDDAARLEGDLQTNNRAEYTATIKALERAHAQGLRHIVIHTDSMLLLNSVTKWMIGWKKRGWMKSDNTPVLNRDLLEQLDTLIDKRKLTVDWKHVRAHTKKTDYESYWNSVVDQRCSSLVSH
jgi:ribonuclease HI